MFCMLRAPTAFIRAAGGDWATESPSMTVAVHAQRIFGGDRDQVPHSS